MQGSSSRVVVTFWHLTAALLLAALSCAAVFWAVPAREAGAQATPNERVLVFSKTAGFRHGSIPAGIAAIQRLGAENNFAVDATEDAGAFNDENLARYDAVVFLSTTGDVLGNQQQAAFERYIGGGGGYVGVHAASDTEYEWSWYGQLVGGYFKSHPAGAPQATVKVEDANHPSTAHLPTDWVRNDEWYNFQKPVDPVVNGNQPGIPDYSPRQSGVHVLATVDESTYDEQDDSAAADDHPIAWCSTFEGGGRSFYTGGGHTDASFTEDNFVKHLLGGIRYAGGEADANCGEARNNPPTQYPPPDNDFEQVTLAKGVPNVGEPMSLSVLPDGRVLHNSRDGKIFLTRPNGTTTLAVEVPVYRHDEDGLQNVTADPNFAQNGWVYLYYAPPLNTPTGDAPNEGTAADFERFKGHNRLSRVKMVGDELDMSTEQELLQVEADRGICCHAGGAIDFDAAGNLYLSTGDDSNPFASDGYAPLDERPNRNPAYDAQRSSANTNDLRGKVIRIKPDPATADYTIPEGNLFPETADANQQTRPEIYAMGFRNPFRMTVDDATGYVYVGEYGPDAGSADPNRGPAALVEFNQIRRAGNFGWPYCVGPNIPFNDYNFATNQSGAKFDCDNPVNESPNNTGLRQLPPVEKAWIHYDSNRVTYDGKTTSEFGNGGQGPMAGPVYNYDANNPSEVKLPEFYDGHFFAGDWTRGWIKDIALDANGQPTKINPFFDSSTMYAPMDMEFGPDGSFYVLDYGNGGYFRGNENSAVYKFNYVAGNRSPIAQASADPDSGQSPLAVQFSSQGSRDPDGTPVTYAWDFQDDGTTDSTEANPRFVYDQPGDYTARLTVTDESGKTANATVKISVGNTRPIVKLEVPPNGGFFEFGDDVPYKVTVTDPEDGSNINCSKVEINYILGHDNHGHPLSDTTGCEGTLRTVRDEGHGDSANVFGVVNARYTDSGSTGVSALTGEDEVILQPKHKQAEFYTSTGRAPNTGTNGDPGVRKETSGDSQGGGENIGYVEDGDYISFTPMNLQNISSMTFRVASAGVGGTIEVHLDAPDGPLVAKTANISPTGGWQTYKNVDLPISDPGGTHELYVVFRNPGANQGLLNLNWIDFNGRGVSTNARPQVTATATPNNGRAPLEVSFDGTATDADGNEGLTYAWDFENDGTVDATTLDARHTYNEPGSYKAKLTATDPKGASDSVTVDVVVGRACATDPGPGGGSDLAPSDEFDGTSLDVCRWNAIVREDPSKYKVENGALSVTTTGGDINGGNNQGDRKNFILQSADRAPASDYVLETRLSGTITDGFAQGGLLVYADDGNYVKLNAIADTNAGRINRIELRSEANGAIQNPQPGLDAPANVSNYKLRLTKKGTNYTGEVAFDGGEWQTLGTVSNAKPDMSFGLFTLGVNQPGRVVDFEYFRATAEQDPQCADPRSADDQFDGGSLDKCRWNAIVAEDESKYSVADGRLNITTAPGEIYQGNTDKSNLILQSADHAGNDFVLETKLDASKLDGGFSQAGIMAYGDDDNYVKLAPISDSGRAQPNRIELRSEVNGTVANGPDIEVTAAQAQNPIWLRLTKTGNAYKGEVSFDGQTWQEMASTVSNPMSNPRFGLYAAGVLQEGDTVSFDYFTVDGDDPAPNTPPTVTASAEPASGEAPLAVDFSADATDPDGDDLTYEWDFGVEGADADTADTADATYTYEEAGTYTATVTVTDAEGAEATDTVEVTVSEPGPTDTAKPVIKELIPRDGDRVRDRTPKVGATVLDRADNLAKDDLELYVDGERVWAFDYYRGSDHLRWIPGRKMDYGRHTVRVVAEDASGNREARSWNFRVVRGG